MINAVDWRALAACRGVDPEIFFPIGTEWIGPANEARAARALAVCAACPVRAACLTDALNRGDAWAVLGGTLPGERRRSLVDTA